MKIEQFKKMSKKAESLSNIEFRLYTHIFFNTIWVEKTEMVLPIKSLKSYGSDKTIIKALASLRKKQFISRKSQEFNGLKQAYTYYIINL